MIRPWGEERSLRSRRIAASVNVLLEQTKKRLTCAVRVGHADGGYPELSKNPVAVICLRVYRIRYRTVDFVSQPLLGTFTTTRASAP